MLCWCCCLRTLGHLLCLPLTLANLVSVVCIIDMTCLPTFSSLLSRALIRHWCCCFNSYHDSTFYLNSSLPTYLYVLFVVGLFAVAICRVCCVLLSVSLWYQLFPVTRLVSECVSQSCEWCQCVFGFQLKPLYCHFI